MKHDKLTISVKTYKNYFYIKHVYNKQDPLPDMTKSGHEVKKQIDALYTMYTLKAM